ncbi:hypothetical protein HPB52_020809 [Rhipicephalus sanguineus]|uniref:Uncharacterized protein n=1 Tax=Rhipicephalus sanguineus TaxID=34632 RepID=A0A9D4PRE5_RHISA|nr:hypothetical protein HPB52_020809 [Rhipicephalus sanguineus]
MHSNGCPPHESSRRTECISALNVSPSWRATSDSCASNLQVKLYPSFSTPCAVNDKDEPFVIYHAAPARETNCPAARWPLFVAAGQGTVLVHRNIPFYGGHHRPCEWPHCKFFRRPVHLGPGLPTTQKTFCGHPGTNCYRRRRHHPGSPYYDSG